MAVERFVKLTSDNIFNVVSIPAVSDKELDISFNKFVHCELNCDLYEVVCIDSFEKYNIFMLVDENGLFNQKRPNYFPWLFYSALDRSAPIVGDVLFVSTHRVGEFNELDFCGLNDAQINYLSRLFTSFIDALI